MPVLTGAFRTSPLFKKRRRKRLPGPLWGKQARFWSNTTSKFPPISPAFLVPNPLSYLVTFGFDPIWFSLVFVFTLEVGLVAPPVAINIFTLMGIWNDAKYDEVVKGVLPFIIIMVSAILLVVYIRPLSLWLPSLIG